MSKSHQSPLRFRRIKAPTAQCGSLGSRAIPSHGTLRTRLALSALPVILIFVLTKTRPMFSYTATQHQFWGGVTMIITSVAVSHLKKRATSHIGTLLSRAKMASQQEAPKAAAALHPALQAVASTGEWLRSMQRCTNWLAESQAATTLLRAWDDPPGFLLMKNREEEQVSANFLRGPTIIVGVTLSHARHINCCLTSPSVNAVTRPYESTHPMSTNFGSHVFCSI